VRPIARHRGVPITNVDAPTSNLQNIKDKHANQPTVKTCDNLPHPRVASVELQWLDTTHFQKSMNMHNALCSVTERIAFHT